MENKNIKQSALTRKLMIRCVTAMSVWTVGVVLLAMAAYFVCALFNWDSASLIYKILNFVRNNITFFIAGAVIIGWIVIFGLILRRVIEYINVITAEAAKLAEPDSGQIILPEELKSMQDDLNRLRENAAHSAAAAKEAEQRKNDLVVYLAHDLKTPLTSVIGYLTLLRDEPDISAETRARYTGIALDKAQRLEELINEFFDITRFNLSSISLDLSVIDIDIMLRQLASEFEPVLRQKALSCRVETSGAIMLKCDGGKLSRVFDNLLRNAVSYSFAESEIVIEAKELAQCVEVTFTNRGATIPPDKLSRVFEQFFRVDDARGTSGGTGLGLAIAKQIVTLHGGEITAKSESDTTVFTVTLPKMS